MEWYKSKKGWVSAVGGVAYFVLDHWGRFDTAKEIWHLLKPLPWSAISQWIPIFLFALALVFFEVDRRKTKQSPLVIHYAGYGLGGQRYKDVTTVLRGYIKENKVNVAVSNETFFTDPYTGEKKHLLVKYSLGKGPIVEIVRNENDQLVLPDDTLISPLQQAEYANYEKQLQELRQELADARRGQFSILVNGRPVVGPAAVAQEAKNLAGRVSNLAQELLQFARERPVGFPPTLANIHRVHDGFMLRFHNRVETTIYELGEMGIFDYELNALINREAHTSDNIEKIAEKLLALRTRLELKEFEPRTPVQASQPNIRDEWHKLEEAFNGFPRAAYAMWTQYEDDPRLFWLVEGCGDTLQNKSLLALMEEAGNMLLRTPYFTDSFTDIVKESDATDRWLLGVMALTKDPRKRTGNGTEHGRSYNLGDIRQIAAVSSLACKQLAAKESARLQ